MKKAFRKLEKASRLALVPLYRRGLRYGVGAAIEHEAILAFLRRKDVAAVVDVGANCGQFSLLCRRCLPSASIHAFEPLWRPAETFRRLFETDTGTRLIQAAIGAELAEREMHVSKSVDSSSLLPIGGTQSTIFPGTEESHREPVRVGPLDAFVRRDDLPERSLLKIDVQGYELKVLNGCESLLDRFSAVYVECSFVELYEGQALAHEVMDWLHARGFRFARIGLVTFDKSGMSVQGDLLFLRAKR
jgi:FkbM family methyltransferase